MDYYDMLLDYLAGKMQGAIDSRSPEQALTALRWLSQEDWGYDVEAWRARKAAILARTGVDRPLNYETAKRKLAELRRRQREAGEQGSE